MSYRSISAHTSKIHQLPVRNLSRSFPTIRDSILPCAFNASSQLRDRGIPNSSRAQQLPRHISTQPTTLSPPESVRPEEPATKGYGAERESAALLVQSPSAHSSSPTRPTKLQDGEPQADLPREDCRGREQTGEHSMIHEPTRLPMMPASSLQAMGDRIPGMPQSIVQVAATEENQGATYQLLNRNQGRPHYWTWCLQHFFPRNTASRHLGARSRRQFIQEFSKDPYRAYLLKMDAKQFMRHWDRLSVPRKRLTWPYGVFRSLRSTEETLIFLLETHVRPFPDFELVMDVMHGLRRHRDQEFALSEGLRQRFHRVMVQQLETLRWVPRLQRKHLVLYFGVFSPSRVKQLFEHTVDAGVGLSYHSSLALLTYFTVHENVDSALQVLKGIPPDLRLQSNIHLLSRCRHLLKLDTITDDGSSRNFRILPEILQANIQPDLAMFNQIISNAVKAGASAVAWDFFRYMQDRDLPTDAWTYRILLGDAYARRDSEKLDEIMAMIHGREDLCGAPFLMVFAILILRSVGRDENLAPSEIVSSILRLYSRSFSTTTLKHLRIVDKEISTEPDRLLTEPDTITLAYVVTSFILAQRSPVAVDSLRKWVEHLRSERDGLALELTSCRQFYDGFITFYGRKSSTVGMCLDILQTMMDRNVTPAHNTWRILLTALTKHHMHEAADHLRTLMERRSISIAPPKSLGIEASGSSEDPASSYGGVDHPLCSEEPSDTLGRDVEREELIRSDDEDAQRCTQLSPNEDNASQNGQGRQSQHGAMANNERQNSTNNKPRSVEPITADDQGDRIWTPLHARESPIDDDQNNHHGEDEEDDVAAAATTTTGSYQSWSQFTEQAADRMRLYFFIHLDLKDQGPTWRSEAAASVADSSRALDEIKRRGFG